MTIAELIRKLQSLDVDPDSPINFYVNDFNKAEVDSIDVRRYTHITPPDGSWKLRKEVDFYLQSNDL